MSKASRRAGRTGTGTGTGSGRAIAPAAATKPQTADRGISRGPAGTARAGRREQRRPRYDDRTFLERHRGALIGTGVVAVVALVVAFVFVGATAKTYACTTILEPEATPAPSAGASPRAGYLEPDMGRSHIRPGDTARYAYCPPASGDHYAAAGLGPIQARYYGPDEIAPPQGWIHNLEHGALVLLYRCGDADGSTCNEQSFSQFRAFVSSFPDSPVCALPRGQLGPVVARFDDMRTPFAALVWGRVLPLETLDIDAALEFFRLEAERTNPERQCAPPSPSPSPADAAPSASPSPEGSPSPEPSPSQAASPSPEASPSPS